jgi:hypothetical protein
MTGWVKCRVETEKSVCGMLRDAIRHQICADSLAQPTRGWDINAATIGDTYQTNLSRQEIAVPKVCVEQSVWKIREKKHQNQWKSR